MIFSPERVHQLAGHITAIRTVKMSKLFFFLLKSVSNYIIFILVQDQ